MVPPSLNDPLTVLVAVTEAGERTVVVALAVLLALSGSLVPADAVPWLVSAPAVLGAVTPRLSVALKPLPRLPRFHRPVAGLYEPSEAVEVVGLSSGKAGNASWTSMA